MLSGSVTIAEVSTASKQAGEWDRFVRAREDASFYHLYEWRGFFSDYFRKRTFYLSAFDRDGGIRGVLPLVYQRSRLFGRYLVSVPFVNYGGVLADNLDVARQLRWHAAMLAREIGASHVEFRDRQPYDDLPAKTDKVAMLLDLPDTQESLFQSLGAKLRSQIKRSARAEPGVSFGSLELVDLFYKVFSRNMRDIGTPVYPKSMFVDILRRFPEEAAIVVVTVGSKPAAAAVIMQFRGVTEIPWASTIRDYNPISINMLLYWEALKFAIRKGSRTFDFGRSSVDSGTYRFKKQWGAKAIQLYWHYWLAEASELPQLNPRNPKYGLAIRAWRKLPLVVANTVGPYIVRNLP